MSETKTLLVKQKKELIRKATTYYFPEEQTLEAKTKRGVLFSLDTAISALFIAPLVIANWHGVWLIYDFHAEFFPPVQTFFFANCVLLCCTFIRDIAQDTFNKYKSQIKIAYVWKILAQIYVEIYNVLVNMQWRGAFMIFDLICSVEINELGNATAQNSPVPTAIGICVSLGLLIVMKSLRNSAAVPFIIIIDNPEGMFHYPTRFRRNVSIIRMEHGKNSF